MLTVTRCIFVWFIVLGGGPAGAYSPTCHSSHAEAKVEQFAEWKSEIKEDLRELNASIKDLGAAIHKLSEPKWMQWAAGAGLLLTCGAGL